MMYLLYHDDSKYALADKIAGGIQAFQERFHVQPSRILVNEKEQIAIPGVEVKVGASIQPGDFWIGPVEDVWI